VFITCPFFMEEELVNMVNEPQPDYEKAEMDLLRDALKRTHEERFFVMTKLMRMSIMLKNAKVTHKPFPLYKQP
jgi:hypothetical protein